MVIGLSSGFWGISSFPFPSLPFHTHCFSGQQKALSRERSGALLPALCSEPLPCPGPGIHLLSLPCLHLSLKPRLHLSSQPPPCLLLALQAWGVCGIGRVAWSGRSLHRACTLFLANDQKACTICSMHPHCFSTSSHLTDSPERLSDSPAVTQVGSPGFKLSHRRPRLL